MKQRNWFKLASYLGVMTIALFLLANYVSAAGTLTVSPSTDNTDNLIGATNSNWVFTVTTTQTLAHGDIFHFTFPTIFGATPWNLNGVTLTATSGMSLYSSLGTSLSNQLFNPSFENSTSSWTIESFSPSSTATSIVTSSAHGNNAILVSIGSDDPFRVKQSVTVPTNTQYTLSYYSKAGVAIADAEVKISLDGGPADCAPSTILYYNFTSSSWSCIAEASLTTDNYYISTSSLDNYTRQSFSFYSSVSSTDLQTTFNFGGEGALNGEQVLLDAVQLESGAVMSVFNIGGESIDVEGVAFGSSYMAYGYVNTTTPTGTFSFTIGGIDNPSGRISVLSGSQQWQVEAGSISGGPTSSLVVEKFSATSTNTIIRAGGSLIVDGYTGLYPSNYTTSTASNYTFKFTPTSSIPVGGKIVLEFPSDYANLLNSITVSTTQLISIGETTTSTIGGFTTSTSIEGARRVILTVSSTAITAADPLTITIYDVTNPSTAGIYGADSAGPGNRFNQYITKSNNGLLDGSFDPNGDNDFGSTMGPPPPSSVTIGGKHTVNILAQMITATTTRNLTEQEKNLLQVVMGNPDKGYFIGSRRLDSNSTAQYAGLLDGTYMVGATLLNKTTASNYDSMLSPGMKTISLLSSNATVVTNTIYFAVPDTTSTITLTGGVAGQYASVLGQSTDYMSHAPVYTDQTYTTAGFDSNGIGYAKVKIKSGQDWSFNVMGGQSFGQNTNFSTGSVKYWPPSIASTYISASGTLDLGSYAYTQADKNLVISLLYAGTATPVNNACVGVKRSSSGGMFMGEQDMICSSNGSGATANQYVFKVPSGAISISIGRPGGGKAEEYPVAISNVTTTKSIYLSGVNNYISVTVQDSNGNLIRNASVFAKSSSGFGQGMTGSNGTSTLYVPIGTYNVQGFAPGFGALTAQNGVSVSQGTNPSVTFTVNASNLRTITGQVTQGGSGLSGVKIGARGTGSTSGGNGAETDTSGNYTLYLPAGIYDVGGWSADTGGLQVQSVDVTSGNQSAISWTLGGQGTLRINITNATGVSPLFGGASNTSTGKGNYSNTWTTSGTSKFTDITLPAGSFKANAGSPITGPIISDQDVTITAGQVTTINGNAQGSAELVTVTGSTTLSGVGVANVNVWASQFGSPKFYSTLSDSSGTYSLKVPANGSYRIGVKTPGYITTSGDEDISVVTTTLTKNFTLEQAASTITGQVTSGGLAVSGGWISARKSVSGNEVWTGAPTDANGSYTLNVDSGTWMIFAETSGYQRSTGTSTTAGSSNVDISLTAVDNWVLPTPFIQGITDTSGGQISSDNATLNLPANALGNNSSIISVSVASTTPRRAPNATALNNSTVSISASNSSGQSITSLNSNADLTLSINADDLTELKVAESDLQFAYFDESTGQWEPMAATIDTTNHTISVQTSHFTDFSPVIGGPDAPANLSLATTTAERIGVIRNIVGLNSFTHISYSL